jgi:hypothetical protein
MDGQASFDTGPANDDQSWLATSICPSDARLCHGKNRPCLLMEINVAKTGNCRGNQQKVADDLGISREQPDRRCFAYIIRAIVAN